MSKLPLLRIRDENGNFIPINAIRGDKGKSAYEQAKEGGYKGTEQEFIALLNGLTNSEDADHYSDFDNPHNVTAEQTGAIPNVYASNDLNTELMQGVNKMTVCNYHGETLNTPYSSGLTPCTHGIVITNSFTDQYGSQLCMPSGDRSIYVRELNGQSVGGWVKLADMVDVGKWEQEFELFDRLITETTEKTEELENKMASCGTDFYMGNGDCGNTKPTTIEITPNTQAVIVYCATQYTMMSPLMCLRGQFESVYYHPTTKATILNMEWTNTHLKIWHASSAEAQFNKEGTRYGYMLING